MSLFCCHPTAKTQLKTRCHVIVEIQLHTIQWKRNNCTYPLNLVTKTILCISFYFVSYLFSHNCQLTFFSSIHFSFAIHYSKNLNRLYYGSHSLLLISLFNLLPTKTPWTSQFTAYWMFQVILWSMGKQQLVLLMLYFTSRK